VEKQHPFGYTKEGKIFRTGFLDFPDFEIGHFDESTENPFERFEKSFNDLSQKISDLEAIVAEAQNKGSYLVKLLHLKDNLATHPGLGNYEPLYHRLVAMEIEMNELIAQNRLKNLEIKRALIADAEAIMGSSKWPAVTEQMKDLRMKWIKTGGVDPELSEQLEERFKAALDVFFKRKFDFFERKRKVLTDGIAKYQQLVADATELNATRPDDARQKTRGLIERWKAVPKIPSAERQPLWAEFIKQLEPFLLAKKPEGAAQNKFAQRGPGIKTRFQPADFEWKKKIIARLEVLNAEMPHNVALELDELKLEWKRTGNNPGPDGRRLQAQFISIFDLVRERDFINRVARGKVENYSEMTKPEKVDAKMNLLKELLLRDEKESAVFMENFERVSPTARYGDKMLMQKKELIDRKLNVKKRLLEELAKQKSALNGI
jgi:hypothetical protein